MILFQTKNIKIIIFYFLFLVIYLSNELYAQCALSVDIQNLSSEPDIISKWMQQNIRQLNANCYFYIGEKYFQCFTGSKPDDPQKKTCLSEAKKYLSYAAENMDQDSNYRDCLILRLQAEALSDPPNWNNIINYSSSQPLTIDEKLKERLINLINSNLRNYNSDFLNQYFPEEEIEVVSIFQFHSEEIRTTPDIHRFKEKYYQLLNRLQVKPQQVQKQNVEEMLNLLRQRENMKNITPYISACQSWINYYDLVSEKVFSTADDYCNHYKRAIAQLRIAKQTFSFAVDACNINCKQHFYCNASNVKSQINSLITNISAQNIKQKIENCNSFVQYYSSTISECFTTPVVEDERPYLGEIQTFLLAMGDYFSENETSIRLGKLSNFFQNTQYKILKKLAGHYIGWVYYSQLYQKLMNGPGKDSPLTVLNRIQNTKNEYQLYTQYTTITGDQVNYVDQHDYLTNFFSQPTIETMRQLLPVIDKTLKRIWGTQRFFMKVINSASTVTPPTIYNVSQNVTQPVNAITADVEALPLQSTPKESNDSLTPLKNAVNAFDHFEYYDALKYYKQAYSDVDIESLNPHDLENLTWGWTPSSTHIIRVSDINRIALLLYMKQISQSANKTATISSIMSQNREYPVEIAWHFAEMSHTRQEKSSDSSFFSGLAYFMSNNPHIHLNTIDHFINAWRSLNDSALFIAGETIKQRTRKKLERVQYWIKKVWRNYTPQEKNVIKNTYRTGGQIFQLLFQSVIGEPLHNESAVTSSVQSYPPDDSDLKITLSETNITPSRSHTHQLTNAKSTNVDARKRIEQYAQLNENQCNQRIQEIHIFFNELIDTYSRTGDAELLKIYNDNIMDIKCIRIQDRGMFDLRFRERGGN